MVSIQRDQTKISVTGPFFPARVDRTWQRLFPWIRSGKYLVFCVAGSDGGDEQFDVDPSYEACLEISIERERILVSASPSDSHLISGMARTPSPSTSVEWIKQITNTAAAVILLFAIWRLR